MRPLQFFISFLIILLTNITSGLAQEVSEHHFQHYSIREGLSSTFTYCTYEDRQGFLWIGTSNGLYLSDGNRISLFHAGNDSSSLLTLHSIKCIIEDSRGNLWIGTQGQGVFILDTNRAISRIIHANSENPEITHNEILSLAEDAQNRIWIGTENGVNVVSADRSNILKILPDPGTSGALEVGAILSICPDNRGNIWLGTWGGGVYKASIQSKTLRHDGLVFSKFIHDSNNPSSIGGNNVWQVLEDSLGRIWLGVLNAGISVLPSSEDTSFITISADPDLKKGISNQVVFSVFLNSDHRLWVSSSKGLSISQPIPQSTDPVILQEILTSTWQHLLKAQEEEFGPISNRIRHISKGNSGNIWLSTEAGISSYYQGDNLFINHHLDRELLWSSRISAFCQSDDNGLLLAIGNSIYHYQPTTRTLTKHLNHSGPINAVYQDYKQRLWFGSSNGLFVHDRGVTKKAKATEGAVITKILLGPSNKLWIASQESLYSLPLSGNRPESLAEKISELPNMDIHDIIWETESTAWLATTNHGLVRLTVENDLVTHHIFRPNPADPQSLRNQNFTSLCLNGEDIWISTSQGLLRYHISGNTFSAKSLREGLLSPSVYDVMRDEFDQIWIVSPPGIAKWDEENQQFIYFDHRHGLISQDFNNSPVIQSGKGKWVIAGEKGLSFFDPSSVAPPPSLPTMAVTKLSLFNTPLTVNEIPEYGQTAPLTAPIHQAEKISLNYQQNTLSLAFSDMSYREANVSMIRYQLKGLEKNWQTSIDKREVSYANLAPSTYIFSVQARDHFGRWGPEKNLIITITPPFWETFWFRIIFTALIVGLIVGIFYWRARKAKIREEALSRMVLRRTNELEIAHEREFEARVLAEEANKVKSSFLSTMSHEIRTPLNAVIGTAHLLLEDSPRPEQEDSLQLLNFSAKNLLTLINDILDFSKMEAGKLELEEIPFNMKSLVRDVVRTLAVKADESGISINWDYQQGLPAWYVGDQTRLSQILINLVGNAIKFTPKGEVRVKVSAHKPGIKVEVIDTGIGIPADRQTAVFEEFSQSSSSTTRNFGGTGLGLAITGKLLHMMDSETHLESEESVGSNFYFYLNLPYAEAADLPQNENLTPGINQVEFEGLNFLIAEDNLVNQKVITKFMKKWGITHEIVANGALAVEAVSKDRYDLILMDMNMPVMDGIEATATIRSNGFSIPILGLSAATLPEEVHSMKEAGMQDVIPKPFDPKILRAKISKALLLNQLK